MPDETQAPATEPETLNEPVASSQQPVAIPETDVSSPAGDISSTETPPAPQNGPGDIATPVPVKDANSEPNLAESSGENTEKQPEIGAAGAAATAVAPAASSPSFIGDF
ncbi:MAG: hypothetical protein Q7S08_03830 [bacterium]|nr:hypothetical protein [bacterium]